MFKINILCPIPRSLLAMQIISCSINQAYNWYTKWLVSESFSYLDASQEFFKGQLSEFLGQKLI